MIRLDGLLPHQIEAIRAALTIPNRRKIQAERFSGAADPNAPDTFVGYELTADGISVAPGAVSTAARIIDTGVAINWNVDPGPVWHLADISADAGMDEPYQTRLINAGSSCQRGVFVGPCGSGKTRVAIKVACHHKAKWLILVHTRELREQWVGSIEKLAGVKASTYSTTRKKRWDPKPPFLVATVQALRRNLRDVEEIGRMYEGVIVDEAHHTPCGTFIDVLRYLPAPLRFGFTATPDRVMGDTELMYWYIGPEIARVERSETEASGRTMRPRLELLVSDYEDTYDPDVRGDDARVKRGLYEDPKRLKMIIDDIIGRMWFGEHHVRGRYLGDPRGAAIVITQSIPYGERIFDGLVSRNIGPANIRFVSGPMGKRARREAMDAVASGEARILIATSLADEGLDIPRLDTCWLVTPVGNPGRCEQRWGRVARAYPDKQQPLVIHVVDPGVARVTIAEDGARRVHRVFANQFRRCVDGAYRGKTDYDEVAMRRRFADWRRE